MKLLSVIAVIFATVHFAAVGFARPPVEPSLIRGFDYGPFRDGQSPDQQIFPSAAQLAQDIAILAGITTTIRTYSTCNGFDAVIPLGAAAGLEVIPGAFLRASDPNLTATETGCLINAVNRYSSSYHLPFAVVGTEAVSEQGLSAVQLIANINLVRAATGNAVPIATAEEWQSWLSNPSLAAAVDVILVDVYPYYEGIGIGNAVAYAIARVEEVRAAYPGKTVLIGETGWPSQGETYGQAAASLANEQAYASGMLEQTAAHGIGLLYFEAFDEAWKIASTGMINQGHFGLLTGQRLRTEGDPKGPVGTTFLFSTVRSTKNDFNRDGNGDILWQSADGEVGIWEMWGASIIGGCNLGNPGPSWQAVGSGDFNRDGYSDILWQNTDGEVGIWEMQGCSVIGGGSLGNPGPSWVAIGAGDFNRDGYSDILWQDTDGEIGIWEMQGASVIGGGFVGNPGLGWRAIATGDFNGDGYSDILLRNSASGEVCMWEMQGAAVIDNGCPGNPDPSWAAIGAGDFNGDGYSDILWQNTGGEIGIWEMQGASVIGGGIVGNPGAGWQAVRIADFNGDGYSDILLRNPASGAVCIWEMRGITVIGNGCPPNPGPPWTPK